MHCLVEYNVYKLGLLRKCVPNFMIGYAWKHWILSRLCACLPFSNAINLNLNILFFLLVAERTDINSKHGRQRHKSVTFEHFSSDLTSKTMPAFHFDSFEILKHAAESKWKNVWWTRGVKCLHCFTRISCLAAFKLHFILIETEQWTQNSINKIK